MSHVHVRRRPPDPSPVCGPRKVCSCNVRGCMLKSFKCPTRPTGSVHSPYPPRRRAALQLWLILHALRFSIKHPELVSFVAYLSCAHADIVKMPMSRPERRALKLFSFIRWRRIGCLLLLPLLPLFPLLILLFVSFAHLPPGKLIVAGNELRWLLVTLSRSQTTRCLIAVVAHTGSQRWRRTRRHDTSTSQLRLSSLDQDNVSILKTTTMRGKWQKFWVSREQQQQQQAPKEPRTVAGGAEAEAETG